MTPDAGAVASELSYQLLDLPAGGELIDAASALLAVLIPGAASPGPTSTS